MDWKNLLASVSKSVNDHLRLRNDYLVAENRILRHQSDGGVQLTDSERQELTELGAKLGKKALAEIATVARRKLSSPGTVSVLTRRLTPLSYSSP